MMRWEELVGDGGEGGRVVIVVIAVMGKQ